MIYKRLSHCDSEDGLAAIQEELVDRFGELTPPVRALLDSHRLRMLAHPLGIARLDAGSEALALQFERDPPLDPQGVIRLVQKNRGWKLTGPDRLRVERKAPEPDERVRGARQVMELLRGAMRVAEAA